MFIIFFAVFLGVLPTSGFRSLFENPLLGLRYLILPGLTQAIPGSVIYSNFIAAAVQEVRKTEYVTAAIAKGLPRRTIVVKHILKNALIPVVTIAAITFGQIMAGAVITESVFGIPGVGRLLVEAIGARDYAVLQADLMLLVVIFIAANFAADLINAWLDPRIRYD
jgi:peptide/nickel transport system permease protein